jgi:hypothetical protein
MVREYISTIETDTPREHHHSAILGTCWYFIIIARMLFSITGKIQDDWTSSVEVKLLFGVIFFLFGVMWEYGMSTECDYWDMLHFDVKYISVDVSCI